VLRGVGVRPQALATAVAHSMLGTDATSIESENASARVRVRTAAPGELLLSPSTAALDPCVYLVLAGTVALCCSASSFLCETWALV
jgi:hypothetical protein